VINRVVGVVRWENTVIPLLTCYFTAICRYLTDSNACRQLHTQTTLDMTYAFHARIVNKLSLLHKTQHTHTIVLLLFWNLSGTTRVSRYQKGKTRKGKTNLDLLEQEIVSGSGICWTMCKSAPHPRHPRQYPTTQFFYRLDALPAAQPTASKHWRQQSNKISQNSLLPKWLRQS